MNRFFLLFGQSKFLSYSFCFSLPFSKTFCSSLPSRFPFQLIFHFMHFRSSAMPYFSIILFISLLQINIFLLCRLWFDSTFRSYLFIAVIYLTFFQSQFLLFCYLFDISCLYFTYILSLCVFTVFVILFLFIFL